MKVSRLHRPGHATSSAAPRPGAHLTVSSPTDAHEREAERRAARVLSGGSEGLRRESPGPETPVIPQAHDVPGSPGWPLEPSTRTFMEARFGHDFGRVRVHADTAAAEAASAVQAAAYTVGRDIVFGAGRYAPETASRRALLAHQLAHVAPPSPASPSRRRRRRRRPGPTTSGNRRSSPGT